MVMCTMQLATGGSSNSRAKNTHVTKLCAKSQDDCNGCLNVDLLNSFVTSPYVATSLVIFFSLICFIDSINGDFVFDDSEAIINNNDVRWDAPLSSVFLHDFWGTRLTHPSSHKSYRPLTILSFRLNHFVSGLTPASFHWINVLLHSLVSVASLHVFYHLLNGSRQCALLAALLFATHPIHTEAVAGIVGRADLLCALFVFFALLSFVKAVQSDEYSHSNIFLPLENNNSLGIKKQCSKDGVKNSLRLSSGSSGAGLFSHFEYFGSINWLATSAVCTSVAMLCKEVGITALGLCSAYELICISCGETGGGIFCFIPFGRHRKYCVRSNYKSVICRQLFLFIVGLSLLMGRWLIMGSAVPKFMHVDNPASFMETTFFRIMNYNYTYFLNIVLLLVPVWLCFDWSMGCIPLIEKFSDPRLLTVPLLWLAAALVLWRGLSGTGVHARCLLMSLAIGVIPFLPASNLFFRVGFVIAERVLYIPVAGLCCMIVMGMRALVLHYSVPKRVVLVVYCALLAVFVLRSRQRTQDWLNEQQLFKTGLEVCPLNAKVHYNLGKVAGDSGDLDEAAKRYREAIRLNPDYDQAMNNLANILKDQGSLTEAEELLNRATALRPDFAAAWMNLGIVQASLGQLEAAHLSYSTALQHRPIYPDCLYNLGNLYLERGMRDSALSAWRNATALKPSLSRAWINTLILLDSQQEYELAVETAYTALKHLPTEASIHFNLANTLGKLSLYEKSETHFRHATNLEPSNANYWANLGVLYHRWKKYKEAEVTYRHTLQLNPHLKSAQDNLNMLLKSFKSSTGSAR